MKDGIKFKNFSLIITCIQDLTRRVGGGGGGGSRGCYTPESPENIEERSIVCSLCHNVHKKNSKRD